MKELWKEIPGYAGKYEASTLGHIRSLDRKVKCSRGVGVKKVKGRLLKLQVNKKGYVIIGLSAPPTVKTFTVHQLIALTFFDNFVKGTELNHIDGDKQNNAKSNLETSRPSHNQLHAVRTGLKPKTGKSSFNNVTYVKNQKAVKR